MKEFYTKIIELKNWQHVKVVTPWLEDSQYPKLLGTLILYQFNYFHLFIIIFNVCSKQRLGRLPAYFFKRLRLANESG